MTTATIPATDRGPAIEALARQLHYAFPGKVLSVEIEEEKQERSSKQNKALFGHAYKVIGEATGLRGRAELEMLHRDFCKAFYGVRVIRTPHGDREVPVRTTTTDEHGNRDVVNVGEFSAFYGDVERKAAEFGIWIPAPNPRWFMD